MDDLLNPAQRRSITVTLRHFEIHLRQALAWLDGKNEDGILYREKLNLSEPKRATARAEIEKALAGIAEVSESLALQRKEQSADSLIRSEMSVAWANLLDTQSNKMRGYGEVNPKLVETLDPRIQNLANIAMNLANLFEDADASGEQYEHD